MTAIHLCDRLGEADVDASSRTMVDLQYMEVDGEFSMAIFQHPDSRIRIDVEAGHGGVLRFSTGVKTGAWERVQGPVTFRAGAAVKGKVRWLHECTLDPRRKPQHRAWVPGEVTLPAGTTAVVLETTGKRKRTAYAWSGWADPVVEVPASRSDVVPKRSAHPSVIIITSDACRADMLGCYDSGNAVPTPNIDALAADGLVFDDARANSTTTVGSYATAWTGLHPASHRMLAEWGTFPAEKQNLFELARAAGFRTVFAASELETGSPEQGFGAPFDDVIPCRANPSQDGAVTTRQFLRWLDGRPDAPYLAWVGYYDTHPPLRVNRQTVAAFYEGDPRDPARSNEPAGVRAVHGVEVLAELEPAMALLREGIVPAAVYFRLKDTARALAGELESGPDLAAHLLALEPSVRRGMSIAEFAEWLRQKAALLQDGVVDPELMTWFDEVRPALREIEAEICAGLRGVVDFGYVKAQARAAVAHVDAQVGALVARLREEGAYDDATIAFMSGHGELFGEHGEYGHHQTPLEAVVHIPLVIKPARGAGIRPRHVQGPFELIDLLPTLADLLALPAVDVDGTSRAADIRDGLVIAEHDTVTLDAHGVTVVLRRGAHKLTLTRGWTSVGGEAVRPGTTRLFRVEGTVETPVDDPDMTSAMRATVEEWLTDARLPAVPT